MALNHALSPTLGQRKATASTGVPILTELPENPFHGMIVYLSPTEETWLWDEETDTWVLIGAGGTGGGVQVKFYQDSKTIAATGTSHAITLRYTPLTHSEHVYWNGWYQQGTEWSRTNKTLTVTDTGSLGQVGDVLTVEYAHIDDPDVITDSAAAFGVATSNVVGFGWPSVNLTGHTYMGLIATTGNYEAGVPAYLWNAMGSVAANHGFRVAISGTGQLGYAPGGGRNAETSGGPSLHDGVAHHIAVAHDGSTTRLYVDGVQVHSVAGALDGANNRGPMFGSDATSLGWHRFKGTADELSYWTRTLPGSEISSLYQQWLMGSNAYRTAVLASSPTHHYPLNEVNGAPSAIDMVGGGGAAWRATDASTSNKVDAPSLLNRTDW